MKQLSTKDLKQIDDEQLIAMLKDDKDAYVHIYNKHKEYSINFLKSMYKNSTSLVEEIYHDSVVVLYENLLKPDFKLTCKMQIYINSICRNQLLKQLKDSNKTTLLEDVDEDGDENNKHLYDASIKDWYETQYDGINNEKVEKLEVALKDLKGQKPDCYEMVIQFYYKKKSMAEIAESLNHKNADTTKNLKSRCLKKLTEIYTNG
jgi:RNA polymerase sigma factor (sigma-70 family)